MRSDGRRPDQLRPVRVERGYLRHAEGSALISVGNTVVLCSATVEDKVPPFRRDSGYGWVTAEYSMLPRSARTRIVRDASKGRIGGRTHEIQRLVGRSLRAVTDLAVLGERTVIVDCDVIQADGGTRTASITGAFIALYDAGRWLLDRGAVPDQPVTDYLAAVSVGLVDGEPLLDLDYQEDSSAEVDMNVVMTGAGRFVEIQGTAEGRSFDDADLARLLGLARAGIAGLVDIQRGQTGALPGREPSGHGPAAG